MAIRETPINLGLEYRKGIIEPVKQYKYLGTRVKMLELMIQI